jgi:GDPmannose 4,6-dehydratase
MIALIKRIAGRNRTYPAELLLSKGYDVHSITRRSSLFHADLIDPLYQNPQVGNRDVIARVAG